MLYCQCLGCWCCSFVLQWVKCDGDLVNIHGHACTASRYVPLVHFKYISTAFLNACDNGHLEEKSFPCLFFRSFKLGPITINSLSNLGMMVQGLCYLWVSIMSLENSSLSNSRSWIAPCASLVCLCRAALAFVSSSAMTLKNNNDGGVYSRDRCSNFNRWCKQLIPSVHQLCLFHTCWPGTCSSKRHTGCSSAPAALRCAPESGPEPHSPESAGSFPVPDAQSGTEGHRPLMPPAVSLALG